MSTNTPICKLISFYIKKGSQKAHNDDITGFGLFPEENSIITISKDKSMKVRRFLAKKKTVLVSTKKLVERQEYGDKIDRRN